jgi:hypothetical protein
MIWSASRSSIGGCRAAAGLFGPGGRLRGGVVFLAYRGVVRWLALVVVVAAPVRDRYLYRCPCCFPMLVISAGTRNHFALDLDRSVLGVIGVKIENAAQAVGLLKRAARSRELTALTAHEVVIDSDELQIPVRIERKQVVDGLISEYRRAA